MASEKMIKAAAGLAGILVPAAAIIACQMKKADDITDMYVGAVCHPLKRVTGVAIGLRS